MPPPAFISSAARNLQRTRLCATQRILIRTSAYPHIRTFAPPSKTLNKIRNIFIPLCIHVANGFKSFQVGGENGQLLATGGIGNDLAAVVGQQEYMCGNK